MVYAFLGKVALMSIAALVLAGFTLVAEMEIMGKTIKVDIDHKRPKQVDDFVNYCNKQRKKYVTKEEFSKRFTQFSKTLDKVKFWKKQKDNTFVAKENYFSDLTDEEFSKWSSGGFFQRQNMVDDFNKVQKNLRNKGEKAVSKLTTYVRDTTK